MALLSCKPEIKYIEVFKIDTLIIEKVDTIYIDKMSIPDLNIVCEGSSFTMSTGGQTPYSDLLIALEPLASNGSNIYNVGQGGETTPEIIAEGVSEVDSKLSLTKENILIVFGGGRNDLYHNDSLTPEEAYDNIVTYCQARTNAGWKVFYSTYLPKTFSALNETHNTNLAPKLTALNDLLIANESVMPITRLMRIDHLPEFKYNIPPGYTYAEYVSAGRPGYGHYYDGTHMKTSGNTIIANRYLDYLGRYYAYQQAEKKVLIAN